MKKQSTTVDFGASEEFGAHHFQVVIPSSQQEKVQIIECYGFKGGQNGLPDEEVRVLLPRTIWKGIAVSARVDFNTRLKEKKMTTSRWKTGINKLDRMLGKELCVLAWAAEKTSSPQQLPLICSKWAALRPEERWWLFSAVAAEGGLANSAYLGWRKALFYALSEKVDPSVPTKRRVPSKRKQEELTLFDMGMAL